MMYKVGETSFPTYNKETNEMRRYLTGCTVAALALVGMSGAALASAHGGAPAGATLFGRMWFEVQHFFIHMAMTLDAVVTMVTTNTATGWFMLEASVICASLSPLVSVLFATPAVALLTFFLSVALFLFGLYKLARWMLRVMASTTEDERRAMLFAPHPG